jgi:tRNA-dihydrouridine synthase
MIEHTKRFEAHFGTGHIFNIMKKHFKAYVTGFDGAKPLRTALMEARDANEVGSIVTRFLENRRDRSGI